MPTQKKKAKHQDAVKPAAAAAVPAAVQIKSEPLDIKPLGAFVDDRVELIRQAFMCLKPKEITCLAPDGLQSKSIEFIQEQCLDEVLGISTKRLLSIINSTQCPTDTDSSDDEEEQTVEHISLDEISSDSEVEVKPQVKSKKAAKKLKGADGKKTGTSTAAASKNGGDKKSEKEMTVLELLELQARARAIRSQLAQEPVTKIELDSDEEADKVAPTSKKPTSNSVAPAEAAKPSSKSSKTSSPAKNQPKRVRLKRNFRVRQVGDEDPPEEDGEQQAAEQPQKSASVRESRSKSKEKVAEVKPSEETKEESAKSRDSSPEVIPVIPSPETLCISSDSEEEKERKRKASIFVDNIEELDRLAKEKAKQLEAKKAQEENDDTEEGEISEGERSRKESIGSVKASEEKNNSPKKDAKLDNEEELDYDEVKELSDSEPDTSVPTIQPEPKAPSADEKVSDSSDSEAESSSGSSSEAEPEVVKQQPDKKKPADEIEDDDEDDDPDIVEIHDSDDETLLDQKLAEEEDEPEKSWGSRWLESNRVAKVMAASRLGNKVRDKLKKKKKKQKQDEEDAVAAAAAEVVRQAAEKEAEAKAAEEQQPVSTAEVGSVEHYNELMSKRTKAWCNNCKGSHNTDKCKSKETGAFEAMGSSQTRRIHPDKTAVLETEATSAEDKQTESGGSGYAGGRSQENTNNSSASEELWSIFTEFSVKLKKCKTRLDHVKVVGT
ncbi:hypothetical protein pipiens_014710 [Culex pipiens pipiens]|uniref:Uncharacterized protein n=1 Tax=Culex pipiens pipiens TaxID=38569 RepID=A0ABD1CTF1_CULPP